MQNRWTFDVEKASIHELNIILMNAEQRSFENIVQEQTFLYQTVFNSDSPNLRQAALLRVGLEQYKADILATKGAIPLEDRKVMATLAKRSEQLLNRVAHAK